MLASRTDWWKRGRRVPRVLPGGCGYGVAVHRTEASRRATDPRGQRAVDEGGAGRCRGWEIGGGRSQVNGRGNPPATWAVGDFSSRVFCSSRSCVFFRFRSLREILQSASISLIARAWCTDPYRPTVLDSSSVPGVQDIERQSRFSELGGPGNVEHSHGFGIPHSLYLGSVVRIMFWKLLSTGKVENLENLESTESKGNTRNRGIIENFRADQNGLLETTPGTPAVERAIFMGSVPCSLIGCSPGAVFFVSYFGQAPLTLRA